MAQRLPASGFRLPASGFQQANSKCTTKCLVMQIFFIFNNDCEFELPGFEISLIHESHSFFLLQSLYSVKAKKSVLLFFIFKCGSVTGKRLDD
jgi:hypothetical protein